MIASHTQHLHYFYSFLDELIAASTSFTLSSLSSSISLPTLYLLFSFQHHLFLQQDISILPKILCMYKQFITYCIQKLSDDPKYSRFLTIHYNELIELSIHPQTPFSCLYLSCINSFLLSTLQTSSTSIVKLILSTFPLFITHVHHLEEDIHSNTQTIQTVDGDSFSLDYYYTSWRRENDQNTNSTTNSTIIQSIPHYDMMNSFFTICCYTNDHWIWKNARCAFIALHTYSKLSLKQSKRRKVSASFTLPAYSNSLLVCTYY